MSMLINVSKSMNCYTKCCTYFEHTNLLTKKIKTWHQLHSYSETAR